MLVEDKIIVELKAITEIKKEHQQQLLNYLVATNKEVGLLINFGHSVEERESSIAQENIETVSIREISV